MTAPDPRVLQVFQTAGWNMREHPPDETKLQTIQRLLDSAAEAPASAAVELARSWRAADHARRQCAQAEEAAEHLERLLKELADANVLLCHLEGLRGDDPLPLQAVCSMNGQLRELPVHPDVPREELERLKPWEYVRVNAKDQIVVGINRDAALRSRAHGEVVELKGFLDRELGLVRVVRQGQEEEIVSLTEELRDQPLTPSSKLVLHRDAPRWAIAALPLDRPESKFETPLDRIHTRLEDLAGVEPMVERLIEDCLLRLIYTDIRDQFDLEPLRGVLLYSYKPGMGKTAMVRALAKWLYETGQEWGFDVVLYIVKPNELKIVWHGGDAKLVREELCGSIRARQELPRTRPLLQIVVLDEIDSLGKRAGGESGSPALSSAQNDAVQALLAEMDGMIQPTEDHGRPPAHVLWVGMTNRPDMVDDALKRPGRFGDLILESPEIPLEGGAAIMAVYARNSVLPWRIHGQIRAGVASDELRQHLLRPALERVFPEVVLKCYTDGQNCLPITAGQVLAGVHYKDAVNRAKKQAAARRLMNVGVPAVMFGDVLEGLLEQACSQAKSLAADRDMLMRQLRLNKPVARVEVTPREEFESHRYLRSLADDDGPLPISRGDA